MLQKMDSFSLKKLLDKLDDLFGKNGLGFCLTNLVEPKKILRLRRKPCTRHTRDSEHNNAPKEIERGSSSCRGSIAFIVAVFSFWSGWMFFLKLSHLLFLNGKDVETWQYETLLATLPPQCTTHRFLLIFRLFHPGTDQDSRPVFLNCHPPS